MSKNKGSEWRKWDLHFHTPSSYDYKDTSVTNQQIIDGLALNNISVVAITDHHIIDVEKIIALQGLGNEKNITVLPGIEFLSDARGNEPIHFIGIFSQDSDITYIWEQIKNLTEIKQIQGVGKKVNEVYCNLLITAKLIKELGGIITIHAGAKSNSIENITHSLPHGAAQKIDIAKMIDIFEIGKESDIEDYNRIVIPFLKKEIGKCIPMIICSDNHHIANYKVKQNLWIKADTTFEGLKQIIFEPEQRVKIQKEEPDYKEDRLIIEEVKFISTNNNFNPKPICLNKNLNVIIGGKSSGKSLLLYTIASTLFPDRQLIEKQVDGRYALRENDTSFNFEIKTKGGFIQKMYRDGLENSIIPELKYIPQNYLIQLAEPDKNKTGNALNKIVRNLICEDSVSKQSYNSFLSIVKLNDRKRESIIDNYFEIREKIESLKDQLKAKPNISILQENIKSNVARVEELNKNAGMTDDNLEIYKQLQKELDDANIERRKIGNDYTKISQYNSEAHGVLFNLFNKKTLLGNSLENQSLKLLFDENYSILENAINSIDSLISMFELNDSTWFKIDSPVSKIFADIDQKIKGIQDNLSPLNANVEIKKQIDLISESINEDRISLQHIDQLNTEINNYEIALDMEKSKLFQLYQENYDEYCRVISDLKLRIMDLEQDGLDIRGIVKFNFPNFRNSLLEISDGRTASYNNFSICEEKNSLDEYNIELLIEELKGIFSSITETGEYALKSKADNRNAIKRLLGDYYFDYWEIKYRNDTLGRMSTGKASFVILMLIIGLSKSKAPILIDQPEDNLDNRSITTDLVEYLKNKKLDRQIILVTHNANIVVNADAENIIVAHQEGQEEVSGNSPYRFDFINGSIENTFAVNELEKNLLKSMGIREHIADIVEGGKEAFKKREEKYGFSARYSQ
jgi:hypothetical protein